MEQVTLSVEQLEELKRQIKEELRNENKRNTPLNEIGKKYHEQMIRINHGSVWTTIRSMTALLMGYKLVRNIPYEKEEESAEVAEELILKVLEAFGGNKA